VTYRPGKPYLRGRISTVDLLVLISSDGLILKLKILFNLVTKQGILMRRSTVLSLALQLGYPCFQDTISVFESVVMLENEIMVASLLVKNILTDRHFWTTKRLFDPSAKEHLQVGKAYYN
jgi:hypothetical protein